MTASVEPPLRPARTAGEPSDPQDGAQPGRGPWRETEELPGRGRTPSPTAVRRWIRVAEALAIERMFLSAVREGLLGPGSTAGDSSAATLAQVGPDTVLRLDQERSAAGTRRLLRHDRSSGVVGPVESAPELLGLLRDANPGRNPGAFRRIEVDVAESILNEALCMAERAEWSRRVAAAARRRGDANLADHFVRGAGARRASLDLDQWASSGHPRYVLPKVKRGFSPADVLAYSPEFQPRFEVPLAALARSRARVETLGETSPERLLDAWHPGWMSAWRERLAAEGADPRDFVPLPVHPWQAKRVLGNLFREHLREGSLRLLDGPPLTCTATSSTRTVASARETGLHLKLALDTQLTSVRRTISARSCVMGPRITRLLQDIRARDAALSEVLRIAPELAGVHYVTQAGEHAELERQLSTIVRADPGGLVGPDEVAVPCTALGLESPVTRQPLLTELMTGAREPTAILASFGSYVRTLLAGALRLYLVYGIALEAHQQNTFAVFDKCGRLRRFLFRDFGGLRVHEPTLREHGLTLEVHPDRLTVVQARGPARSKLTHSLFHAHVAVLAETLARHFRLGERALWQPVAEATEEVFEAARGETDAVVLEEERRALTGGPWTTKAFLRMRLEDSQKDLEAAIPNPLARGREEVA